MDKKVAIIVSNHYNFETAEYCIKRVIKSLMDVDINFYDIYLIDTSIKQKDQARKLANKLEKYDVKFMDLDHDYAVNSKKNIFYDRHLEEYELFVEIENDVFFEMRNYQWLPIIHDTIIAFEKEKFDKNMVWSFNYDNITNLIAAPTACRAITRKGKKMVGKYPSEFTGEYRNNIEEMVFFPRDTQNLLADKGFRTCTVSNLVELKFDIYSISTNFINYFRCMVADFDYLRYDLSDEEKSRVENALLATKERYEKFGPYPKLSIMGSNICKNDILDILRGNSTLPRGVSIDLYKKIYSSLFVMKDKYYELENKYDLKTLDLLKMGLLFIYNDMYFINLKEVDGKRFSKLLIKDVLDYMMSIPKHEKPMIMLSSSDLKHRGAHR